MNPSVNIEKTAGHIRRLYEGNPDAAESSIERFLEEALESFSENEKVDIVDRLKQNFNEMDVGPPSGDQSEDEVLARVFTLLLGRKVSHADLSSGELLNRLADSLNTVFDSLNQLIEVINQHLYREHPGDETIRQVIGFHMAGENQGKPLESYLGQIKTAFLVAQQGFRKSAGITVNKILNELDPGKIGESAGGGFKFGALKKAEYFEIYGEKFDKVRKWFDSGRFMEDFLKEFEKSCEKMLS